MGDSWEKVSESHGGLEFRFKYHLNRGRGRGMHMILGERK